MRQSVPTEIDFADAEILGHSRNGEEFLVRVKAWNEERVLVQFVGTLGLRDRGAWSVSDLCQSPIETPLLLESLRYHFEVIPEDHGFHVFEFLDGDDAPVLEVIAKEVRIRRESVSAG